MEEQPKIPWKRVTVEATAIVVSILLAFAIDAWWQDRIEAASEQRILRALAAEFEQNTDLLEKARAHYEQRYAEAAQLLAYVDQGWDEADQAEIENLIRGLVSNRTFHLESGAHDGLLASGELTLIRDEQLRNRLAAWPSYVAEWTEEEDAVFSYVVEELVPYFASRMPLREISNSFPSFPDGQSPPPIPVSESDSISLSSLGQSYEFENLVYRYAQGMWHAMLDGETLRVQLDTVLSLIRQNTDE